MMMILYVRTTYTRVELEWISSPPLDDLVLSEYLVYTKYPTSNEVHYLSCNWLPHKVLSQVAGCAGIGL